MPKVNFGYDIKKDAWSWVLIAKSKDIFGLDSRNETAHIPNNLLSDIQKLSFSEAQILVEKYLDSHPKKDYRELIIKEQINCLSKIWEEAEEKYFKILSKITKKQIYTDKFGCFFTTGFMCPYNPEENWFMVSFWHGLPFSITTICHELMHLQFLHYYMDYLKKERLSNEKVEDLKEALTFLLNEPEFEEIVLVQDKGYPNHQELRKRLREIWKEKKDFVLLLDKAVKIMKNEK